MELSNRKSGRLSWARCPGCGIFKYGIAGPCGDCRAEAYIRELSTATCENRKD